MRWRRTIEAMRSSSAPVRWGSYCCIEDGSQVASPRGAIDHRQERTGEQVSSSG